jgi:hypothetical protein
VWIARHGRDFNKGRRVIIQTYRPRMGFASWV